METLKKMGRSGQAYMKVIGHTFLKCRGERVRVLFLRHVVAFQFSYFLETVGSSYEYCIKIRE